jgi:hypothetical protein
MARKKHKPVLDADLSKELWISPRFTLKGHSGDRAWDHRQIASPGSARFLELADVALGAKKHEPRRKKNSSLNHTGSRTRED